MYTSLLDLPWWGYAFAALFLTHITIASVTIYLHRHQTHRALELNPVVSHLFRFWLWLTTAIVTKEWISIHRKHHAKCETIDDPHSPQIFGIRKVLLQGAELYRIEAKNRETLEKYGRGTPDDWLERHLYTKHSSLGIVLMLVIDILLFGPIGLTIWAVQMAWIPVTAAGIINGAGHHWGYRNFQPADCSTNILPWGILIGGEELHNNHHAYIGSAKLSIKWYEFDIGWMYIRTLSALGLSKVRNVAPKVSLNTAKTVCDIETLHAVLKNRFEVMANFATLLKRIYRQEITHLKQHVPDLGNVDLKRIMCWLNVDQSMLNEQEKLKLGIVMQSSENLNVAYRLRNDLTSIWYRHNSTKEKMVKELEDWCHRDEDSGVEALKKFSRRLRCYA
jgi:stearoyl-CoA desaturase (delta-9 desaturase)